MVILLCVVKKKINMVAKWVKVPGIRCDPWPGNALGLWV